MNWLNKIRRYRWAVTGRKKIKNLIARKWESKEPIKVILGASQNAPTTGEWINTDIPQFDITNELHWQYIFGESKADNLLAEHVLEHLTREQITSAIKNARQYMKTSAVFRIAIPDKNNPDPIYQEATRPGGSGSGADDHKVFLNLNDCIELSGIANLKAVPLEYFDNEGRFHSVEFDLKNGIIQRSKQQNYYYDKIPAYTSLIIDLIAH